MKTAFVLSAERAGARVKAFVGVRKGFYLEEIEDSFIRNIDRVYALV